MLQYVKYGAVIFIRVYKEFGSWTEASESQVQIASAAGGAHGRPPAGGSGWTHCDGGHEGQSYCTAPYRTAQQYNRYTAHQYTKLFNLQFLQLNPYSAGIDFSRQNLTSVDDRFWRLKSIPALQE